MDHLRLLGFIRELQGSVRSAIETNKNSRHIWNINPGTVIMPETLCPWCATPLRSNGIWLFSGPSRYGMLEGMIPLDGGTVRLVYPGHPNNTSGGTGRGVLCLGTYQTGMALLAGPANLNDCPMGLTNLPRWYRTYWSHPLCKQGYHWFRRKEEETGIHYVGAILEEAKHLTVAEKRER